MSSFYDRLAETARRLIANKGQLVTLSRPGNDRVFDEVTGAVTTPGTDLTESVRVVSLPYVERGSDNDRGEKQARQQKRLLYLAAKNLAFEPKVGDTVSSLESTSWEVFESDPLNPGGTSLVFALGIRTR